ncbi:hypothetical protein PAXINDRAFT_20549 [Paxillus involutus ATCC 200175]|uniref:Unplaced genomic scaffold PAXINscaffold_1102, whole genome shotgun sequence n=1 Tax=Paxillus involutus ATCC 200175 TaxID=664439 RepID=A0A0C9SUT4_PAXIN|nr:hypothetical protein PAXINDRAFT_20549 [Paxillus involutus ATCC 200175]
MSTLSFTVTSALFIPSAFDALESIARRQITVVRFFQILEVELAVAQERYVPDDWLDVVDKGLAGFQLIKHALENQNPLFTTGDARPLRMDLAAWKLVWDWAAGVMEFPQLSLRMEGFGTRFVYAEWKETFDAIFNASIPSDEGDDIDLSKADNGPPPAIKVVKDAIAALGISLSATRSFVPPSNAVSTPSSSSATRPSTRKSRRPTKRRKTGSIFVDIAAAEVDDTEEEDEGEQMELYHAPKVQPAGRTRYAKDLDRLFECYQGETPDAANNVGGSPHDEVTIPIDFFNMFGSGENGHRIYVVEFFTKSVAMFMRKYFQQRGLQSWDVPRIPHKIYVEATSPHDIRCNAPPSRTSAIRDITLLLDEEHAWFRKADISMRLHSWVRVRRGLYRNDIGYVLACDQTSSDLLLVPRQRPYDDIDEHDVPEVKAQKRRERKLFDPTVAKNAAHSVLPFNTCAGIFRCNDVFYHRGLMRRTFPNDVFEVIGLPHPDDIALHAEAQVDPDLIHRTYLSFSYQFWKEGDLVWIWVGSFEGERATIVAVTLDEGSAKVSLGDSSVYDVPLADLCRLFRGGDTVKVLAGVHRGYLGTVIAVAEDTVTLLLDKTMEVVVIFHTFLETHLAQHVASLTSHHPAPDIDIFYVLEDFDDVMPGDIASVVTGQYHGSIGLIDWISTTDGWMGIVARIKGRDEDDTADETALIVHSAEVVISKPSQTLTYSREKGYNVTIGDTLHIVRGEHHGLTGVVRTIDLAKAKVELVSDSNGHVKVAEFSPAQVTRSIGLDIWIVGGDKKGFHATLRGVNCKSCLVSIHGYPNLEVRKHQLCTDSSILLDGTVLEGRQLEQLKALQVRSFVAQEDTSQGRTPSPKPSSSVLQNNSEGDGWKITPEDFVQSSQPAFDKGSISWLFDNTFCDFSRHYLSFNISAAFGGGCFTRQIMRTACPDHFCGGAGPAPPGCVLLSAMSNHSGRGIEHYNVPARCLTPASPTTKGQFILVLRGDLKGRFCQVFIQG